MLRSFTVHRRCSSSLLLAIVSFVIGTVQAFEEGQRAGYTDVSANAWYAAAVSDFLAQGYLDSTKERFRPADPATRAEFLKIVVLLNGGILDDPPDRPSFDDVTEDAWYFGYLEEAAREGWLLGDGNCYGQRPCAARPDALIGRAEAAQVLWRGFGLTVRGSAPPFSDVTAGAWYAEAVQAAADRCILRGDDLTGFLRPADPVNRAEMVAMLARVDEHRTYPECAAVVKPLVPPLTSSGAAPPTASGALAPAESTSLPPPPLPAPSPAPTSTGAQVSASLFVVADPSGARSRQLLAGSISEPLLQLSLTARSAPVDVLGLTVAVEGGKLPTSVKHLLLAVLGSPPVATASAQGCSTQGSYCAVILAGALRIPPSGRVLVEVRAALHLQSEGARSGESIVLMVAPDAVIAREAEGGFLHSEDGDGTARGEVFVGAVSEGDARMKVTSAPHVVTFAKILEWRPDPPGSAGKVLTPGVREFARLAIVTVPHDNSTNDVVVDKLRFAITSAGITLDPNAFDLARSTAPEVTVPCTWGGQQASGVLSCDRLSSSAVDVEIDDGETAIFLLRGNITAADHGATLSIRLLDCSSPSTGGSCSWSDEQTTFSWVDVVPGDVLLSQWP